MTNYFCTNELVLNGEEELFAASLSFDDVCELTNQIL